MLFSVETATVGAMQRFLPRHIRSLEGGGQDATTARAFLEATHQLPKDAVFECEYGATKTHWIATYRYAPKDLSFELRRERFWLSKRSR